MPNWEHWMNRCLELARQGQGLTHPNPMVGCVILDEALNVIAEGYHQGYGLAHAEVDALSKLPKTTELSKATLVVNLEPCSHHGKTPPCVDAVINSGMKRVVYGLQDPNPKVAGQGLKRLLEAGIELIGPVEEASCRTLNYAFLHRIEHQKPYTTIKMALTLDGKVATRTGQSQWITHEKSRTFAHQLRAQSDAVLSTAKTVISDNAQLTVRLANTIGRHPKRIIIDKKLEIADKELAIFKTITPEMPLWVVIDENLVNTPKAQSLLKQGVELIPLNLEQGQFNLIKLWGKLAERGITNLVVEAGPNLCGSLLKDNLTQKLWLQYGPQILGDQQAPSAFNGLSPLTISDGISTQMAQVQLIDNNTWVEVMLP